MGDHWKSLADKLGAPGMDDPTPSEVSSESEPQHAEVPVPAAEHRPEPKAAEPKPAEVAAKSKKKSSWEALASIFNIRTETPEAPTEPIAEPEVRSPDSFTVAFKSEPKPAPKENRLHVFPESFSDSEEAPAKSALEAMFADAPRGDLDSWKKSPRVVDDLGWDDEPPKSREQEDIPLTPRLEAEGDADEAVAGDNEERRPRRRRRRRGPRRPASDAVAEPTSLDAGDEVLSVESGDEWSEPESFEVGTEESAEVVDPERRSSRRRRRGRKRPVDDSAPRTDVERRPSERVSGERVSSERAERPVAADRAERVANRDSEERPNRRPERRTEGERTDRDRAEPRERTERAERSGRGEPRERTERSERPERERPERQPRVHQERPLPPRADADESDDADELDDSENSAIKHRNIPTWEDSLQSIIEANMANHNRNDNRGGGQSRGRPRGRGR